MQEKLLFYASSNWLTWLPYDRFFCQRTGNAVLNDDGDHANAGDVSWTDGDDYFRFVRGYLKRELKSPNWE